MSRTHKDLPLRVIAEHHPRAQVTHRCTEHGEGWRRPRPRRIVERVEHPPAWHLVVEKSGRGLLAGGPWQPLTGRELLRGVDPAVWKTRRRWVFGAWTEPVERTVTPYVPCDLDGERRYCQVWPPAFVMRNLREQPGRVRRREEYHSPVRAAARQRLALAVADWNTHGDTDVEPDPVNRSGPVGGGWWD